MRSKICGINSLEDVNVVLKSGAHALGFLVGITHLAEDKVSNEEAKTLIEGLPPYVSSVAVTHLTNVNEIIELVKYLGVTTVQIHDYIPPEAVKVVRDMLQCVKIIKAVHVVDEDALAVAKSFVPYVDAILLDSRTNERLGGTGMTHNWNISAKIVQAVKKPVILAGGLTSDNVYEAVIKVKPFGVDVNSGVETKYKKDFLKVSKFISNAAKGECNVYELDTKTM